MDDKAIQMMIGDMALEENMGEFSFTVASLNRNARDAFFRVWRDRKSLFITRIRAGKSWKITALVLDPEAIEVEPSKSAAPKLKKKSPADFICKGCGKRVGISAHRCPGRPRMRA